MGGGRGGNLGFQHILVGTSNDVFTEIFKVGQDVSARIVLKDEK